MSGGMENCSKMEQRQKEKDDVEFQIQLRREKIDDLVGEIIRLAQRLKEL